MTRPGDAGLTPADPGYRRLTVGALCAGLASFSALYATQALLPTLTDRLGVTPATAALTVSATTGALALAVVPAGILAERIGRRRTLRWSVLTATALTMLLALAPGIRTLIVLRAVQGVAVAGVPAVIMVHLTEEVDRAHLPAIMGRYVAGTTVGGLMGRLIPSGVLAVADWRAALLVSGAVAFVAGVVCARALPAQRRWDPDRVDLRAEVAAFRRHWATPRLAALFVLPFLLMGVFVSLYNFLGYRLGDRFGLPEALAGLVFVLYLSGTWSAARAGAFVERFGSGRVTVAGSAVGVVGLLVLLLPSVVTTVLGALLVTAAFFAVHSTASALVGRTARRDRPEASSMYVMCYYVGSCVIGWSSGHVLDLGWSALVIWLTVLQAAALLLCVWLASTSGTQVRERSGD
ncbi:MFS transporter [Corynebacterium bovis]|uniref:YNFM family putative membrane transporter n=1 Tax=Corynebacterium bovis DSM 20582 = CIP 54.80 TaxID=927655 RepID=A0A8I0CLN0_9CORY|nr:MFS transporter [Corynebacterium bovis]MBB3116817.1 YNFM family putative membrane transporter [Corynebacterium bovis DSM 20582 = CIP 54.80]WJY78427.1 Inner membrane transport protein YnfM [Corynebacterium bovis DSM 20582 = CIP 54.80]